MRLLKIAGAIVALVALVGTPSPLKAQISFSQPGASQTVGGVASFNVSAPATVESVEFDIGSLKLGVTTQTPWTVQWNTAYASDGNYAVQATGRDAYGNVVSTAEQLFTINNHGNSLAPVLKQPLSGRVSISVPASDAQYSPVLLIANVDGQDVGDNWSTSQALSQTFIVSFDSTQLPNGKHELYLGLHSYSYPTSTFQNWRAGSSRVIDIENGHSLMAIRANYLHTYLQPKGTVQLACTQLFTDGTSGPCAAPSYSSNASGVATVSAGGLVTANGLGFATITLSDSGRSTNVYVWVKNSSNVPHFAGSGQMVNSYQPGSSLFVVAPFGLQVLGIQGTPGLLANVHKAGINTLSQSFYPNPYDSGLSTSYSLGSFESSYNTNWQPLWTWIAQNGFHLLGVGDDCCAPWNGEINYTLNWPPAQQAIQYAAESVAKAGIAVVFDMIDEVDVPWGTTPTTNGNQIPTIASWVRGASPNVPISWPVRGVASTSTFAAWEGMGSVSDYASHYSESTSLRHTYTWAGGVNEYTSSMAAIFYARQPFVMLDRPQIMLNSASSFYYNKKSAGAYYNPPADNLRNPSSDPQMTTQQMMTAAALGNAGLRLYQFDYTGLLNERSSAPIGAIGLQTGASPTSAEQNAFSIWRAMAYAANPLTKTLARFLLSTSLNSPALGPNILTAARQGSEGEMLLVVNDNDYPRTLPINFSQYRTGQNITRYKVRPDGIVTDVLPDESGETITLGVGESVAYIFPSGSTQYAPAISIPPPNLPAGAVNAALHYGYIYSDWLSRDVDGRGCTAGCTLNLDLNLGPVYYQFVYTDASNNVVGTSAVIQAGSGPTATPAITPTYPGPTKTPSATPKSATPTPTYVPSPKPTPATGISFVGSATNSVNAGATTLAMPVPAGVQNGDLLVTWIIGNIGPRPGYPTTPAGWKPVTATSSGGTCYLWYRIANSEPASYTWGNVSPPVSGNLDYPKGHMRAYRGVDQTIPIDQSGQAASGNPSLTLPALPPSSIAREWYIGYWGNPAEGVITGPSDLTNIVVDQRQWSTFFGDKLLGSAGSRVPAETASTSSDYLTGIDVTIRPAP